MILAVNEAIRALKASATASPTATVTMSPRMRKFLNPVITRTSLTVPPRGGGCETGSAARPWMPTISRPARHVAEASVVGRSLFKDAQQTSNHAATTARRGGPGRLPGGLAVAERQVAHHAAGAGTAA